eukprot:7571761-Pyramimonas_sp.AAC.1
MVPPSQRQAEKGRIEAQSSADAARREGERAAREQAAQETNELRDQRDGARLEAENIKLEAARALHEQDEKPKALRDGDKR